MSDLLSKCEHCGKITPADKLLGIYLNGVRWNFCSFACAEEREQLEIDRKAGKK